MRRRRTAHRFGEKRRTTDVLIDEKVDFSGLMLSSDVLEGLKSAGFERPSPIQLKAIPLGRCGLDLIAQAKSGTGKTCVFSVIALENINLAVTLPQVLVLAPTREIAVQIKDVMCSIGRHLKGLRTHVFIGGMPLEHDKNCLKQCHIAIGSPGRVKHLIESKLLQTTSIRLFILDEADKLLDENFQEQINWIYSTLPTSKQMLALSATYPDHLAERLKNYMKDPTFVRLNAADPALEGIRHYHCVVPAHSLPHKVFHEKIQSLLQLLSKLSFYQCLIFSNYQIRAKNLSETLAKNGWPSTYISGSQGQNERLNAMAKLKEFKCRILISTDLTSRGIDAERVNLVINMDLPRDSETYLHRVGRAGRFGSYGVAINFVADGKEVTSLNEIEASCGVTITSLPDDVSKLLSDEMMHASQQKRFERHEVTSFNNTSDKMANNHKTNNNQNGELVEKEQVEIEFQTIDGNFVDNDTEIERVEKIEEDIAANGEAGNQHTGNKMEENIKVEHNQRAENKLENTARARNIQNEDITIENTIEERTSQNESITIESTAENVQKEGVMLRNSIAGRNIQQTGIVKENEVEHKDNENFTVNADQENDIRQETTDEIFVVEDQKIDSRINYTVNERCLLQRDMVSDTDVGTEADKRINVPNDEEKLLEMNDLGGEHEVQQEERKDLTENVTDNNKTVGTNKNCEIIFRNPDTGLLSTAGQFNGEDFVSDGSESEFSSSEETGSSDESCDSHVPVSCKDFDNVLEAYLKDNAAGSSNTGHLTSESHTLNQSLKSTRR
ncbi:probable ATP-dependent RNA helicase DDX20 [Paramuricea clavata]|uniref:Probable ATP-dependent RNA helicase DDX20 n=1 Tax=Paramuricea clavata TaxID=317549 RepID=A0A7D9DZM6_PARCT|nr:probable ATP-dependent RNA helicase DDX20 [Paramuricea clavata]